MRLTKGLLPYILVMAILMFLKLGYTLASNNDLLFLLFPLQKIVGWATASTSFYLKDKGFYFLPLSIAIDKSCAGFNFWLIASGMLSFLSLHYNTIRVSKVLAIAVSFAVAYLLTIMANASRILLAIQMKFNSPSFLKINQHLLHEAIGIVTYVCFLALCYLIANHLLNNRYHAKIIEP